MMANFCRENPGFDLKFACNFKGCLDNRPLSMMGAIEHQAFHFCETFKTQSHFNFKCDFCNVYHVNKSHHRLCLNDPTGNGHITYLRSVFTVPMSDQEYHDCVDFSRFANQHMLAVTSEGVRLIPDNRCPSMPRYSFDSTLEPHFKSEPTNSAPNFNNKRSSVSYRDIDNDNGGGDSDRFNRQGGNFADRNQSGPREYRGRGGRGGFRGRGDRGGFSRGRGRGGGYRDADDNNNFGGRDEIRRGRGRGGGGGFREGASDSFRSRTKDSKFQGGRSYSRSHSRSPVTVKKPDKGFDSSRPRSYSRSRSESPPTLKNIKTGSMRARSYSRSGSCSPPPAKKSHTDATSNRTRSYSRSLSESPPPKRSDSPVRVKRPSVSYSRSESSSRSPSRNDENNNRGEDIQEKNAVGVESDDPGRSNPGFNYGSTCTENEVGELKQWSNDCPDNSSESQSDTDRNVEHVEKNRRERSYSRSPSTSP
ncbi:hypothetical protein RB195_009342 [Necator americanus]|uniref:C2H2-type domain-containing protein n=1 Tax=Necator americanus TaxID=51031 RepID=A0ABR1CUS9_NECAM